MAMDSEPMDSEPIHDQLAGLLRTALDDAGMRQADLARLTGLSPKHINQMVHGKSGATAMYDYAAFVLGYRWAVTLEPIR
jgi:transcriptional regulator with XRE-family HTH domain